MFTTYLAISLVITIIASTVVFVFDHDMPASVIVIIALASLLWPIAMLGVGVAIVIAVLFMVELKRNDVMEMKGGLPDDE